MHVVTKQLLTATVSSVKSLISLLYCSCSPWRWVMRHAKVSFSCLSALSCPQNDLRENTSPITPGSPSQYSVKLIAQLNGQLLQRILRLLSLHLNRQGGSGASDAISLCLQMVIPFPLVPSTMDWIYKSFLSLLLAFWVTTFGIKKGEACLNQGHPSPTFCLLSLLAMVNSKMPNSCRALRLWCKRRDSLTWVC